MPVSCPGRPEQVKGDPADRAGYEQLKAAALEALLGVAESGAAAGERAVAAEALQVRLLDAAQALPVQLRTSCCGPRSFSVQVVREWEWPVHAVNAPPPSSLWSVLGLQA